MWFKFFKIYYSGKERVLELKCGFILLVMEEEISVYEIIFKFYVVILIKNKFEFLECIMRVYEYIRLFI